jgi:hypothetical protein
MKYSIILGTLVWCIFSYAPAIAAVVQHKTPVVQAATVNMSYSPEDIRSIMPEAYEKASGRKMSLLERTFFKVARNKVARKLEKSKLDQDIDADSMGFWSAVAGIAGFLVIWIPIIRIIGFLLGIAGLVLGILSVSREGAGVTNILGIIFGAAALLIFL